MRPTTNQGVPNLTIQWDARELVTYSELVDCSSGGTHQTASVLHGVLQAVSPGHYRAEVGVFQNAPGNCTSGDNTLYTCQHQPGGMTTFANIQSMCAAGVSFAAVFDLPAVGDVGVTLPIPNLGG